ncbi:hypothetical protein PAPYR_10464 [Paratrimastix pyriformis]|uniref:Uncharacterized protein n=1 Tax=Paratrimastix pyriformis TaxID=342808 RepID=A0ABQ8U5W8_9EUKA|nr:hypothetical protein PAPYR_10464 [Paratrimastix pyriformis]
MRSIKKNDIPSGSHQHSGIVAAAERQARMAPRMVVRGVTVLRTLLDERGIGGGGHEFPRVERQFELLSFCLQNIYSFA